MPKIGDQVFLSGIVTAVNNYEKDTKAVVLLDDGQSIEITLIETQTPAEVITDPAVAAEIPAP